MLEHAPRVERDAFEQGEKPFVIVTGKGLEQ
jgi:hypothetical protein